MSEVSFRAQTEVDRRMVVVTLEAFAAAHKSGTRLVQAMNELLSDLREAFIERDCDGDHRLRIWAGEKAVLGVGKLKGSYLRCERNTPVEDEIKELLARMEHDHALINQAWSEEHAAMMLEDTGEQLLRLLPAEVPVGLIEDLTQHIQARAALGVAESIDASWPEIDDGLIPWIEEFGAIFSRHYGQTIFVEVCDRRSGENFIHWTKKRMPGRKGFYEHASNLNMLAVQLAEIPRRIANMRSYDPACA